MLNKFKETFAVTEIRTFKHEPFFFRGGGGGAYLWYFTASALIKKKLVGKKRWWGGGSSVREKGIHVNQFHIEMNTAG